MEETLHIVEAAGLHTKIECAVELLRVGRRSVQARDGADRRRRIRGGRRGWRWRRWWSTRAVRRLGGRGGG
jgi:hypothetical protein